MLHIFLCCPQEPKPKRMCEDVSPKKKADLEQWVEEVKQQWRDIQARRAARRHKRYVLKCGKFFLYLHFSSVCKSFSLDFCFLLFFLCSFFVCLAVL